MPRNLMVRGNNRPNELTPEQEIAILALLNQPTAVKAAEEAKVGPRTLDR